VAAAATVRSLAMPDQDELVDVVVELRDGPAAEKTMPALRASFEDC
jgi:hypothetical protein